MSRQQARVKAVLSGDTVILRSSGKTSAERQLSLEKLTAPRLSNGKSGVEDEAFAFESRDYLRCLLVGKQVSFEVTFTTQGGREYGRIYLGNSSEPINISCVREGWCRIREDAKRRYENEDLASANYLDRLIEAEEEAKEKQVGVWCKEPRNKRIMRYQLQDDARVFLEQHKGKQLDAIIEQVRDGSTLRVQFIYPGTEKNQWIHQYATVLISGIRAPAVRAGTADKSETSEPFGEDAKSFVELRLLQRTVKIIIEGVRNQNLVGSVLHPAGNIAELLVAEGLAYVSDATVIFVTGGTAKLRAAERAAKEKKLRLWKNYKGTAKKPETSFSGIVTRIVSGDTIHVLPKGSKTERKIRLASIRQPRTTSEIEAGYAVEAKEFLRKRLIGKTVQVSIDYIQPAQDNFEERECATVRHGNVNIAELLLKNGLASVIYHRQDDENRAKNYDVLRAADEAAKEEGKGIHSGKPKALPRYIDASEDTKRAATFLSGFKRSGRVSAIVEHIIHAGRFRLIIPKENCKLTFVLSGIRVPRLGRSPEESEEFAQEAFDFVMHKCMQRDVEVEFESTDKSGGFIGTLWVNKNENIAISLLENGLVTLNEIGADQSPYTNQLYAAMNQAKRENKNIWKDYEERMKAAKEAESAAEAATSVTNKVGLKVVVTTIDDAGHLSVQVVNDDVKTLENLVSRLSLYHKQDNASAAKPYQPKVGELCSAQFSEDKRWYRARIRRITNGGKSVEVVYIDYGNSETLPKESVRALPKEFTSLPPQSREINFAFLKVPARASDYGDDAYDCIAELVGNKTLTAVVEAKDGPVSHVLLYDDDSTRKVSRSLNAELVRSGFATVDRKAAYAQNNQKALKALLAAEEEAHKMRRGMWEYGDITED